MAARNDGSEDFLAFYRRYARSGIHAAAAALLTLFGLLASIADHWAFVGVGVAIYVLPPAYLYATGTGGTDAADADASRSDRSESAASGQADSSDAPESGADAPATGGDAPSDNTAEQAAGWQWRPKTVPTDADLAAVTAAANGTYVAGTGGVLFAVRDRGCETLIEAGAGGDGNDFTAVDATDDGQAVWAVGDGGAVARVNVGAARHVDRSAPGDRTSTWTGVAAAGPAGSETVYLSNGSGVVLRGTMVDDEMTWGEGRKPGSGSSIADLDFEAPRRGAVCDTAGGVFETLDGETFQRRGIDDIHGTPTAVVVDGTNDEDPGNETSETVDPIVATDAGSIYRYGPPGWTSDRASDAALYGLTAGDGERIAVGERGAVVVDGGDGWGTEPAPVDATLRDVALCADGTALAVGDAGVVVERLAPGDTGT